MKNKENDQREEITEFPEQSTFNEEDMRIQEEKEGNGHGICYADKTAGSGE